MSVGALYAGVCYASQSNAVDAYYSNFSPYVTSGVVSYYTYFTKVSGNWLSVGATKTATGNWVAGTPVNASAPTFPVCDTAEAFVDGHLLGWGVGAAMILVWCVKNLKRGM